MGYGESNGHVTDDVSYVYSIWSSLFWPTRLLSRDVTPRIKNITYGFTGFTEAGRVLYTG